MSRPLRTSYDSGIFHITCRGNNQQDVFHDEKDYQRYLKTLSRYKEKHKFKLYAYVLMSNHLHLLLQTSENHENGSTISKILQTITISYYRWYQKRYGYSGHLWQGRFRSYPILDDSYLLTCIRYIELNPIRVNICTDPSEYKWSSYKYHAFGIKNYLVDTHEIFLEIGRTEKEQREKYIEFINEEIKQTRQVSVLKLSGETVS